MLSRYSTVLCAGFGAILLLVSGSTDLFVFTTVQAEEQVPGSARTVWDSNEKSFRKVELEPNNVTVAQNTENIFSDAEEQSGELRALSPRGESNSVLGGGLTSASGNSPWTVLALLGGLLVIAVFVSKFWLKNQLNSSGTLPSEAFTLLGRTRLEQRQSILLMKVGSRVLVVGSSNGELSTLSEITDPQEAHELIATCQQGGHGRSANFSAMFRASENTSSETSQFSNAPTQPGNQSQRETTGLGSGVTPEGLLATRLRQQRELDSTRGATRVE
ncbi:flagellar biosynthetic protein FliO [Calycomorphotria hydatis]|uniref:Flagellar biosynthesis protein, FliO n=1 Tax=Calycomorphotria hydatis TaxID=2528027 RepID=A0A517TB91_9PLAN|nr:flagellar biosynthetic protein FliO [Calycomorphotria hydatis]QDT65637.1 Flagellar biosynthesis protein, FliO [Calycomorphotria hydatis]